MSLLGYSAERRHAAFVSGRQLASRRMTSTRKEFSARLYDRRRIVWKRDHSSNDRCCFNRAADRGRPPAACKSDLLPVDFDPVSSAIRPQRRNDALLLMRGLNRDSEKLIVKLAAH